MHPYYGYDDKIDSHRPGLLLTPEDPPAPSIIVLLGMIKLARTD